MPPRSGRPKPCEKSRTLVAPPRAERDDGAEAHVPGKPEDAVATMRSRSEPGTSCVGYGAALGIVEAEQIVAVLRRPCRASRRGALPRDRPARVRPVEREEDAVVPVLLPSGSEMITLPKPGTSAAQQRPLADSQVKPR